jgi:zinc transporter
LAVEDLAQDAVADLAPTGTPLQDGLIWGFDFDADAISPLAQDALGDPTTAFAAERANFRWLHVNSSNQLARSWIESCAALPEPVQELLLERNSHQRSLIVDGYVACVLHDFETDFGNDVTARLGPLAIAVGPHAMLTARHHPLAAATLVRRRIDHGVCPQNVAQGFDLVVSSILDVSERQALALAVAVQASEDRLLADGAEPDPIALVALRREAVRLHRQLSGIRTVLQRLEQDEELPEILLPPIEKLYQRASSHHGDVVSSRTDLRLLRDEIDLQMTQKTNRNLYVLSILSALLLPATLVTGFFGMNTGGMPWSQSQHGTFIAAGALFASAASTYIWLRRKGLLRNR